eukprot:6205112-Pleurochrysis_carterae.AAC.1
MEGTNGFELLCQIRELRTSVSVSDASFAVCANDHEHFSVNLADALFERDFAQSTPTRSYMRGENGKGRGEGLRASDRVKERERRAREWNRQTGRQESRSVRGRGGKAEHAQHGRFGTLHARASCVHAHYNYITITTVRANTLQSLLVIVCVSFKPTDKD